MLAPAPDTWTLEEAAHLLNRAGFGGSPEEIRDLHALGRVKAVDSLLDSSDPPDSFPVPQWATREQARADQLARQQARQNMREQLPSLSPEAADQLRRETFRKMREIDGPQVVEAQAWWFRRMLRTRAPLRERMTLFWHDHFATSARKVRQAALMFAQNELFRTNAVGNFHTLAKAIVHDPAMVLYLDSQNSSKQKPNENLARELMELFTLGEGQYTERDIHEAARALTGCRLDLAQATVRQWPRQRDATPKTIFGQTADYDADSLVDLIFSRPRPAAFLAEKLWAFFVSDTPAPNAIAAMAEMIRESRHELRPALRALFLSKAFYDPRVVRSHIKCPVHYLVAMLKQLGVSQPPVGFPLSGMFQLGQVLFMPPNVAGWDWGKAWISTNTLLARYNLAGYLTHATSGNKAARRAMASEMGGMMRKAVLEAADQWQGPDYERIAPRPVRENPEQLVDALVTRFFQAPLPAEQREPFLAYAKAKHGVVFTNKEVAELCHLMLSTPAYQLC